MIESQNPEVDIPRLKESIDRDMARGRLDDPGFSLNLDDSDLMASFMRPPRASVPWYVTAPIQPSFTPNPEGRYSIHQLLAYHDAAFIQVAYLSLLGRAPDQAGFEHYLRLLHEGHSKAEILGALRDSEEGKAKGVQVDGLAMRARLARLFKKPVVGKLAAIAVAVAQLPATLRNQRRFEDHMVSVLGQVQENARAQSERLRQALELLAAEQDAIFEQFDRRLTRHRTRMELLRGAVSTGRAKLSTLEQASRLQQRALDEARKAMASAAKEDHLLDGFYADFESRFRGPEEEIKKRQSVYLPVIEQAGAGTREAPVLDLGCGRGEWLGVLAAHGLVARGADLNRVFIKDNRARGLDVLEQDALACLRSLESGSMGAVTAFHLIEHLPFRTLIAIIDEALRVLKPGGVLIFETPNPSNLQVGACNFYLDPTHRNPIPSGLSVAMLELRGFQRVSVTELQPFPETELMTDGGKRVDAFLNRVMFGPQDYGVMGWKAV